MKASAEALGTSMFSNVVTMSSELFFEKIVRSDLNILDPVLPITDTALKSKNIANKLRTDINLSTTIKYVF